ncbi:MAG: DUF1223 domain-containing protein [Rhodopseudomonas palustris]|nr:DUF1223 domain-containing protein [Rhodopseudomonas palustris]
MRSAAKAMSSRSRCRRARAASAARSGSARSARAVPITIGRGENRGRSVTYHNVVRNWLKLGDWHGQPAHWNVPLENLAGEGVDGAVVFVQNGNREHPGTMLGAALTTLH